MYISYSARPLDPQMDQTVRFSCGARRVTVAFGSRVHASLSRRKQTFSPYRRPRSVHDSSIPVKRTSLRAGAGSSLIVSRGHRSTSRPIPVREQPGNSLYRVPGIYPCNVAHVKTHGFRRPAASSSSSSSRARDYSD